MDHPREEPHPPRRSLAPLAAIALTVFALDQATKIGVRNWLERGEVWPNPDWPFVISRVENSGAAFGLLQGQVPFLVITTVIALAAIAAYLYWAPVQGRLYVAGFGLVLGGAFGNLIDRVLRGSVTDFLDPVHYPAFNVADSAIVVGVITLIALSFFDPDFGGQGDASPDEPARARSGHPSEAEASEVHAGAAEREREGDR